MRPSASVTAPRRIRTSSSTRSSRPAKRRAPKPCIRATASSARTRTSHGPARRMVSPSSARRRRRSTSSASSIRRARWRKRPACRCCRARVCSRGWRKPAGRPGASAIPSCSRARRAVAASASASARARMTCAATTRTCATSRRVTSMTRASSSRNTWRGRGTWKCRSSATRRVRPWPSASATAPCSAAARRSWRSHRHRI